MKRPGLHYPAAVFWLILAWIISPSAQAETPTQPSPAESANPPTTLRVGVHDKPPYAYQNSSGDWYGLGVELWKSTARSNGWEYTLVQLPYEELLPALVAGKIDVVVGELLVNPIDEAVIDFSQPFIETTVGVAIASRNFHPSWLHILTHAFDWTMLRILYGFVPALLLISLFIWLIERRRDDGHFAGSPARGLGSAFWFSTVTMTSTGYGDKVPVTFLGRTVAVVWMIVSLLLVTAFTASVASTVASVRAASVVRSAADLRHYRNGILDGSIATEFLNRYSAPVVSFQTYEAALQELISGSIDTVVGDAITLDFLSQQQFAGLITRLPLTLYSTRIAFALPPGSPLREKLNVSLLQQLHSPDWPSILDKYLGNSHRAPAPPLSPTKPPTAPRPHTTP